MKRMLACILAIVLMLTLGACRRTDGQNASVSVTPFAPTAEPPVVPIYDTSAPSASAAPTDAAPLTPTDAAPLSPAPTETAAPQATQIPLATAAPQASIVDAYTYSSISNSTLKVKFAYPETWTSSPSTDTITFVEPVSEGDVAARLSVTSFAYSEAKPSTKRLKEHLQDLLKAIVKDYNEYQVGSVAAADFVGSAGLSATYLAVQGESYISGRVVMGYAKNGRVYAMYFACEQSDFDAFAPLVEKLAGNVSIAE